MVSSQRNVSLDQLKGSNTVVLAALTMRGNMIVQNPWQVQNSGSCDDVRTLMTKVSITNVTLVVTEKTAMRAKNSPEPMLFSRRLAIVGKKRKMISTVSILFPTKGDSIAR